MSVIWNIAPDNRFHYSRLHDSVDLQNHLKYLTGEILKRVHTLIFRTIIVIDFKFVSISRCPLSVSPARWPTGHDVNVISWVSESESHDYTPLDITQAKSTNQQPVSEFRTNRSSAWHYLVGVVFDSASIILSLRWNRLFHNCWWRTS
jgi:hypothetical protein